MKEIYLVEDDEGIRELLEFLLMSKEFKVKSFSSAGEFQRGLAAGIPDLILLDIMLPDGNGMELCREVKENTNTENIPVVLMSAHTDITITHCANDFVAKPFDIDDLLDRINKQIA